MTNEEYMNFMTNPDNSHKCEGCSENINADNWQGRLPCGQWRCWVDCHTERGTEE